MTGSKAPLYVAADIHGHRAELRGALVEGGLVDEGGRWIGGAARLWLLGDYVDRGPDGIGVMDDIRELAVCAAAAGGEVTALLGNHEVQLLAAHHFGTSPVEGLDEPGGFQGGWARFGGRDEDLRRLTPDHVAWMSDLPAVALVDDHLLVHSDTTRYLEFGSSAAEINAAVAQTLRHPDSELWVNFSDRMSDRGAFRANHDAATLMLDALGGSTLVHGHSTLTRHFGIAPRDVKEALRYAGGRVLAIDGGVYEGGRILLTRLR